MSRISWFINIQRILGYLKMISLKGMR